MKTKFSREAKIAVVTLVGLFLLYFGVNYLKGVDIFQPSNVYYVNFKNVTELQKSAPVYVEGFKVGIVNDIIYDYKTNGDILVELSMDKSMKIERGTYVEMNSSLTAGSTLHLVLNKHITTYLSTGDTLEGRRSMGMMDVISTEILPHIGELMPKLDSILTGLQMVVTHPALTHSLNHIEQTTANLSQSTARLNSMMARDIPQIMTNFRTISSDFTEVSAELKNIDFEATMKSVDSTIKNLDRMTARLNSRDNSLGLLLNDKELYNNLNQTALNASNLMLDLKENPKRYVRFSVW